jgi:recombination protein RecT
MTDTKAGKQLSVIETMEQNDKVMDAIKRVMPSFLTADRFMSMAIACSKLALRNNPNIIQSSILVAVYQAARAGLELDENLGHAYLVPFKSIVTMIPGYRGLVHLARLSGKVRDIKPYIAYEKDDFDFYVDDRGAHIRFTPNLLDEDRGAPKAGFAQIYWLDGAVTNFVMPYHKINKIGAAQITKAGERFTPWKTHREEMDLKTVVRAACKMLPQTPELSTAIAQDEGLEIGRVTPIPDELLGLVGDDYKRIADESGAQSSKPEVSQPKVIGKWAKAKAAAKPAAQGPAAQKAPETFLPDLNEAEYLAEVTRVKEILSKQGITEHEIGMILVKGGFSGDVKAALPGERRAIVKRLSGYIEAAHA